MQRLGPMSVRSLGSAGGGYGDPKTRPPEAVLRDVRDGVVSREAALTTYAVALTPDARAVDAAATQALRAS